MKTKKTIFKGFTLIEILIFVSISVILAGGILTLVYIVSRNRISTFQNLLNVDETNSQISTMIRELRNIRPGDNGAYPLEKALDQEIIFYSDIDYDGVTEKVRYTLSGTQLVKGVIEPTGFPPSYPLSNEKVKVLSTNIRNHSSPIFYYYNGGWPQDTTNNPLPQPVRLSDSKLVKVFLIVNTNENDPNSNFSLESYVQLRMLKQNL